jgi:phosphatidylinositol dimannoside acyltransferase
VVCVSANVQGWGVSEWRWRAFKIVQSVVERLPRAWAYALAVVAARFAWRFSPLARPRLEYNLAVACPELTPKELRKLSWLNFRNHAKAYADLMLLPRMKVEAMRSLLHVDEKDLDYLEEARALGKGVMVVSCHMGSYEVVSAIWSATLAPVSLFAEELEPRALFEWYRDTRARLGISVLPLHLAGLRKVTQALQEQEMVVTAIDRDITGTGHVMPFFGRPAPIPLGPAALSLRLGTPLLPVCVYRLPDDTYQAEATSPVMAKSTGDPKADEVRVTQELLSRIEAFIRRHPEQWHVPHRIWEGSP